ncbi:MAG: class III poly(R)-hydroxyalkanoic acid synthase subunit PhaE [Xanthomonadales bacterium]|nr:class III poly(R)-hydroxyalkanoic acid synthase subunit PhaE [Xanthomonadales bacterium]
MAQATDDFQALARRYWGMWGEALRDAGAVAGLDAGRQGFGDALDGWRLQAGGPGDLGPLLDHVARQGKDWFARMQQVASQFAGRDHSARDVAEAWRNALGLQGDPFRDLLRGMRGPGLQDLQQWSEAAAPWLHGLRGEAGALLGMPAFGFAREHQERAQALAQSQLRWQDALSAWQALMGKASQDAFDRFESKLAEREEPGRQIGSVRALFDLWVDAAEDAYAELALSPEFRRVYGELANAQMRLRADAQAIAEQAATLMGLPGRTELDSAHRKIAELERQLRRMQRAADPAANAPAAAPASKAAKATRKPVSRQAAKPAKAARPVKAATQPKPKPKPKPAKPAPVKQAAKATRAARKPASSTARRKR